MCCSNRRFYLLTNTRYFKFPELFKMMDCYAHLKSRLADKSLAVVPPTSHCLMRFVVSLLLRESKQTEANNLKCNQLNKCVQIRALDPILGSNEEIRF